jgi:hypothetical protein
LATQRLGAVTGAAAALPIEALRFVVPAVASRTVASLWVVAIAVDTATMVAEATACRWQWAPSVLLPSELQQRAATTATDIPLTAIQPTDILPAILTSRHARPDVRLR